ncbi:hypothetical protein WJX73_006170 [Symbiochloris irregularis]|uniref:Uncharacterized protein n=1 Tax=Symbiochloris irregularis TaxID=706552 RepID=A0AAW1Q0J6_9CHLO
MFRWRRSSSGKSAKGSNSAPKSFAGQGHGQRPPSASIPRTPQASPAPAPAQEALHPITEAHLCQLAVFENYAEHGLFVKFGTEEAVRLEARALDLAVQQSTQDAELAKRGLAVRFGIAASAPNASVPTLPFTHAEASGLIQALRQDPEGDVQELPAPEARRRPGFPSQGLSRPPAIEEAQAQQQGSRPTKSFSAFKRHFLPLHARLPGSSGLEGADDIQARDTTRDPGPSAFGNNPDFIAEDLAEQRMELANGFVIPMASSANMVNEMQMRTANARAHEHHQIARAMEASRNPNGGPLPYEEDEEALLALAMEESRIQAEFDDVLREAIELRRDLEGEMGRCRNLQVRMAQKHRDHLKRGDRAARHDGAGVPPHLAREAAESEQRLQEVDVRVNAVAYAIQELSDLEHFIRTTKPSFPHAQALTEEIIKELLRQLSFLGLHFGYPHEPAHTSEARADPRLVDAFRMSASNHQTSPTHRSEAAPQLPNDPPSPQQHMPLPPTSPHTPEPLPPTREEAAKSPEEVTADSGTSTEPPQDSGASAESLPADRAVAVSSPSSGDPEPAASAPADASIADAADGQKRGSVWPLPVALASRIPRPRQQQQGEALQEEDSVSELPRSSSYRSTEEGQEGPTPPPAWPPPPPQTVLRSHSSREGRLGLASRSSSSAMTPRSEAASVQGDPKRTLGRASSRLSRLASAQGADAGGEVSLSRNAPWSGAITAVKRTSQVVHLYNELRKVMPERMERQYTFQSPTANDRDASDGSTLAEDSTDEESELHRVKQMGVVADLATELETMHATDMGQIGEFLDSAHDRLASVTAHPAAALEAAPTFPLARWKAMRAASCVYRQLNELTEQEQQWAILQPGHHHEEGVRIEQALDEARGRVLALADQAAAQEARWVQAGAPWDRETTKRARFASLHLAHVFMAGVLEEVTVLERASTLQHEACLHQLADAVRVVFKAHQLAGGLHPQGLELFDQIKRLTRYYIRVMDPTWLRAATQLVGGVGTSGDQTMR